MEQEDDLIIEENNIDSLARSLIKNQIQDLNDIEMAVKPECKYVSLDFNQNQSHKVTSKIEETSVSSSVTSQ